MLIDDYVTDLRRSLNGPYAAKRDLVVEARDSLLDAAESFEAGGLDRRSAERRAVEEFGPVGAIAPGFQEELVACAGRRLAWLLFLSVPAIALMWALVWRVFPYDVHEWARRPDWFVPAARALDIAQLASGVVAGVLIVALRRGADGRRVTRALAFYTWALLGLTFGLSSLLVYGSHGPMGFSDYLPGTLISMVSYVVVGVQAWHALQCQRLTRPSVVAARW